MSRTRILPVSSAEPLGAGQWTSRAFATSSSSPAPASRPRAGSRPFAGRTGCGRGIASRTSRRPRPLRAIRRWSTPSTMRGGRGSATVEPNAAHRALARLDAEWPGELLHRHPECRRSARARRREAAAAHAWRADNAAGASPATSGSAGKGRWARTRPVPTAASRGRSAPTSSGSARCPTRWSRIDEALASCRPVRLDRHVGRRLSRRRLRPDRALLRRADARDEPRAEPGQPASSTRAGWAAAGDAGSGMGRRGAWAQSAQSSPMSR